MPSSTPTPEPTPTPTPTPAPGFGCAFLPPSTGDGIGCPVESPHFLEEVEMAIDQLAAEEPDIFDKSDQRGGGGFKILSVGRFYVGLVERIEAQGLCATFDGFELNVRNSNDFNDQFDVELATQHVRRGEGIYRTTCRPAAAYPVRNPPAPSAPTCNLPASVELACGREPSAHFLAQMEAVLDEVLAEHPELFDFSNTNPGTDWPFVINQDGYFNAVVAAFAERGFCARWDGEEMAVKDSNEFNDQFDILLSGGHIRRGEGSYRSSCYPAAF